MGYAAWSVVFGEQPSAAKWNILGTNDSSFNDGTGIGTNAIAAASLATSAITLGYAQITGTITTTATSATQATGLTSTVTIPAGSRRIKITAYTYAFYNNTNNVGSRLTIWDGTVGSGTQLSEWSSLVPTATGAIGACCLAVVSPSAGSKTYNIGFHGTGASTTTLEASSTHPAFIHVEAA